MVRSRIGFRSSNFGTYSMLGSFADVNVKYVPQERLCLYGTSFPRILWYGDEQSVDAPRSIHTGVLGITPLPFCK